MAKRRNPLAAEQHDLSSAAVSGMAEGFRRKTFEPTPSASPDDALSAAMSMLGIDCGQDAPMPPPRARFMLIISPRGLWSETIRDYGYALDGIGMFNTSYGDFNGKSWEALCQQVFKSKYAADGYQHIPASPGDYGLEGFCAGTGHGFQCYCPEKHYTQDELYEHQRDKITDDLKKLKTYAPQLEKICGDSKLRVWRFVTPVVDKNALIFHARSKEKEVRSWGLSFVAPDFKIELHDADYYIQEINQIRLAAGESLDFDTAPAVLATLGESPEIYEQNLLRKSKRRLDSKADTPRHSELVARLNQQTLDSFLESDEFFRQIERTAPPIYLKLVRLINEFEFHMSDTALTWSGTPEELTASIRRDLEGRLVRQLGGDVHETTASKVARHVVARWLAICSLDYD